MDARTQAPGAAVVAFLDRRAVREGDYGIERNDVAQYVNNPAYRWSGYRVVVPLAGIAPGRHIISIGVVTGRSIEDASLPRALQLEIARS